MLSRVKTAVTQPEGRHMPWPFSLVSVWPRSWQIGSFTLPPPPGRDESERARQRALLAERGRGDASYRWVRREPAPTDRVRPHADLDVRVVHLPCRAGGQRAASAK
eukprot:scaffold7957_cov37-Tisochrysis_lutea.AAC.2